MKRLLSSVSLIMLLFMLCSCNKVGYDLTVKIASSDKSLVDLASVVYDESQLSEIIASDCLINELNAKYPIECLRRCNDMFRVSYRGNACVAVLLFDNSGKMLNGSIYTVKLSKSDFDGLSKGKSLEDVRTADPDGVYSFLYTGRNDIPKASAHYTKDGYLIKIEYDDSNTIISISAELI